MSRDVKRLIIKWEFLLDTSPWSALLLMLESGSAQLGVFFFFWSIFLYSLLILSYIYFSYLNKLKL